MENQDFIKEVMDMIRQNLSDERFGVSELAGKMNLSRSGLLRKIKKHSDLSVSQLLRNTRLEKAKELLTNSTLTVSEVAFAVGFGSSSYFIKCFHDHYGYPPGQTGKMKEEQANSNPVNAPEKRWLKTLIYPLVFLLILLVVLLVYFKPFSKRLDRFEKTIAVLPFINDSNDSSNVYLINGLMESILNDLQKIEDLHVISRTSIEKFRGQTKSIPELSNELSANYFVEGSGQKIGDEIVLHIQLLEGPTDRHLWSGRFRRSSADIFSLQNEISRIIAEKVEAIITPEEAERIDKIPTKSLLAYDHFLKGLELLNGGNEVSVGAAIPYFMNAIQEDKQFARAYSALAIAYYFLDAYKAEKLNSELIGFNADKALYYDEQLPQGHVAKALFYININEYSKAIPYFENALQYNPNSELALGFLTDFYANVYPDTEKYLEYALKSTKLDIASRDSISASYIFLHLANAFIQSGFAEEAEVYIDRSLAYDTTNLFSVYVKAYILYAKNRDLRELNASLVKCLEKDSSRYDILQEVAKSYYYLDDFEKAEVYYNKFLEIIRILKLDVYHAEYAKMALVKKQLNKLDESSTLFNHYHAYAEVDQSLYRELSLAIWSANQGKTEEAFGHLDNFSRQENFHYWTLLFLPIDPLVDPIKDDPRFDVFIEGIGKKFWEKHRQIKSRLEKKGLI